MPRPRKYDYEEIARLRNLGLTNKAIARHFNVRPENISWAIRCGVQAGLIEPRMQVVLRNAKNVCVRLDGETYVFLSRRRGKERMATYLRSLIEHVVRDMQAE